MAYFVCPTAAPHIPGRHKRIDMRNAPRQVFRHRRNQHGASLWHLGDLSESNSKLPETIISLRLTLSTAFEAVSPVEIKGPLE